MVEGHFAAAADTRMLQQGLGGLLAGEGAGDIE